MVRQTELPLQTAAVEDVELHPYVILIPSKDSRIPTAIAELEKAEYIGFDLETAGDEPGDALNPWINWIRLISVALPSNLVIVFDFGPLTAPTDIAAGTQARRFLNVLHNVLQNPKCRVRGQTLKFDFHTWLCKYGYIPNSARDLMLMSQVFWAGLIQFKHSLAAIAERCDVEIDKTEQTSDWGAPTLTNRQINYSADDALKVNQIFEKLEPRARKAQLIKPMRIECEALPSMIRLEHDGIPVDIKLCEEYIVKTRQVVEEVGRDFREAFPDLSPHQSRKLPGAIASKYGIHVGKTDQDHLAPYWHIPAIKSLSLMRTAMNSLEYLEGIKERYHDRGDGWVRPEIKQINSKGWGRVGIKNPNLQNPPNPKKTPPELKALGIPDVRKIFRHVPEIHGDRVFVSHDLATAHARLAVQATVTHGYPDEALINEYNRTDREPDIHCITASRLAVQMGKPAEWSNPDYLVQVRADKSNPQNGDVESLRAIAKPGFFGPLNGQGAKGIQVKAKTDYGLDLHYEQAKGLEEAFKQSFKGLVKTQRAIRNKANAHVVKVPGLSNQYGIVKGLSGRRCFMRYDYAPWDKARIEAGESPGQFRKSVTGTDAVAFVWTSAEACAMKWAGARLYEDLLDKDARWCNLQHDSWLLSVPRKDALEVAKLLQLRMKQGMERIITCIPVDEPCPPEKLISEEWS
jgi:hypothetical protein